MSKATPGPWTVDNYRDGYYKIREAQEQLEPDISDELSADEASEIDEANSRMIEVAPSLVEALTDCIWQMELCEKMFRDDEEFMETLTNARNVLVKVGGEKS